MINNKINCWRYMPKIWCSYEWKKVIKNNEKYNLMAKYIRKSKNKNNDKTIKENVKSNLLKINFITDALNKVWYIGVTYLIFKGSRVYLSTILDLYDRYVVVYKISKYNDNKLVMDTISKRKRCTESYL